MFFNASDEKPPKCGVDPLGLQAGVPMSPAAGPVPGHVTFGQEPQSTSTIAIRVEAITTSNKKLSPVKRVKEEHQKKHRAEKAVEQ